MDSLEIKVPEEDLEEHLPKVRVQRSRDRKAKGNKVSEKQQKIAASKNFRKSKAGTRNGVRIRTCVLVPKTNAAGTSIAPGQMSKLQKGKTSHRSNLQ